MYNNLIFDPVYVTSQMKLIMDYILSVMKDESEGLVEYYILYLIHVVCSK